MMQVHLYFSIFSPPLHSSFFFSVLLMEFSFIFDIVSPNHLFFAYCMSGAAVRLYLFILFCSW